MVTEGNYLLYWDAVRELLDLTVYLDAPPDERLAGLIERQRAKGLDADEALDWVLRSDEANARLVQEGAKLADLHLSQISLRSASALGAPFGWSRIRPAWLASIGGAGVSPARRGWRRPGWPGGSVRWMTHQLTAMQAATSGQVSATVATVSAPAMTGPPQRDPDDEPDRYCSDPDPAGRGCRRAAGRDRAASGPSARAGCRPPRRAGASGCTMLTVQASGSPRW